MRRDTLPRDDGIGILKNYCAKSYSSRLSFALGRTAGHDLHDDRSVAMSREQNRQDPIVMVIDFHHAR